MVDKKKDDGVSIVSEQQKALLKRTPTEGGDLFPPKLSARAKDAIDGKKSRQKPGE